MKPTNVFTFFQSKSLEELQSLSDIGQEVARSIFEFFHNEQNEKLIKKLTKVGVVIKDQRSKIRDQKLKGKIFVLTGTLSSMTREEAKEKIRLLGGEVSESVTKKTSLVVIGEEPGSKLRQAKQLGIKTIGERELTSLLK